MSVNDDPEAPHGREEDGTPKAPNGHGPDGTPKKLPGRPSSASAKAPKAPAARKPSAKKGTSYREGILGLIQMPAAGLALAGMKKPALAADAATITAHAPGLADALDAVAQEQPAVAAVLDRVLSVGPYGLVLAAAMPMALQLLVNHKILPPGLGGTVPVEDILAGLEAEQRAMADAMGRAA